MCWFFILYLQLMFGTSLLNIYLFQKMKLGSYKFKFPNFQQLRTKRAKYTFYSTFVIVTQHGWDIK